MSLLKQPKTLIIAIILLAILLSVEVFLVRKASDYEPKIKVIYAKVMIPSETVITRDMLVEKDVALSLVSMKAIKDATEAVGKVARFDIEEMEMMTKSRLMEKIDEKKIEILDKKNRLITIKFEPDQINGWWVEDRVDIIFVPNDSSISKENPVTVKKANVKKDEEEKQSELNYDPEIIVRLENVRVAAIIDESRTLIDDIENTNFRPVLVSFEVTTEQDMFLSWAKYNGKIEVAARKAIKE